MRKTTVWQTATEMGHSGYFIWSVEELEDLPAEWNKEYYTLCRDGSWVALECFHVWTEDEKNAYMDNTAYVDLVVTTI